MIGTKDARISAVEQVAPIAGDDLVAVADDILTRYGPRAVSLLTSEWVSDDGCRHAPRMSANDCYVALPEACRKMARVAVAKRRKAGVAGSVLDLGTLFPDGAAYLSRAIRSVVSDAGRASRREPTAVSLDAPIAEDGGGAPLLLGDAVADETSDRRPLDALLSQSDRAEFRAGLKQALKSIPSNYLSALARDLRRERERQAGSAVVPATESERQTLCRARAAVVQVMRRECTADNPYIWLVSRQRNSRVARKQQPATRWTGERQDALIRRLLDIGWAERAARHEDGCVGEAIVNDVSTIGAAAPPTPEVRKAMRVLDLYTVDRKSPATPEAAALYDEARRLRSEQKIEEALRAYRACYEAEPSFIESLNEVGVMYSQLGRLRDALRVYVRIIGMPTPGEHRYIAATNAADIYLTWFDAGRNREQNLELARRYAEMAMERPSPMRACNLILAYVKDRYYLEAKQVLEAVVRDNRPECRADRFLQTLFQIRDQDLITWWTWLEKTLDGGHDDESN